MPQKKGDRILSSYGMATVVARRIGKLIVIPDDLGVEISIELDSLDIQESVQNYVAPTNASLSESDLPDKFPTSEAANEGDFSVRSIGNGLLVFVSGERPDILRIIEEIPWPAITDNISSACLKNIPSEPLLSLPIEYQLEEQAARLMVNELEIIRCRNGVGTLDKYTLESLGQKWGLTRERIRQLQKKAELTCSIAEESSETDASHGEAMFQNLSSPATEEFFTSLVDHHPDVFPVDPSSFQGLPPKIFRMSVNDLNLSSRSLNCLLRAGIDTVGKVVGKTWHELRSIRNFGMKSFSELCDALELIEGTSGNWDKVVISANDPRTDSEFQNYSANVQIRYNESFSILDSNENLTPERRTLLLLDGARYGIKVFRARKQVEKRENTNLHEALEELGQLRYSNLLKNVKSMINKDLFFEREQIDAEIRSIINLHSDGISHLSLVLDALHGYYSYLSDKNPETIDIVGELDNQLNRQLGHLNERELFVVGERWGIEFTRSRETGFIKIKRLKRKIPTWLDISRNSGYFKSISQALSTYIHAVDQIRQLGNSGPDKLIPLALIVSIMRYVKGSPEALTAERAMPPEPWVDIHKDHTDMILQDLSDTYIPVSSGVTSPDYPENKEVFFNIKKVTGQTKNMYSTAIRKFLSVLDDINPIDVINGLNYTRGVRNFNTPGDRLRELPVLQFAEIVERIVEPVNFDGEKFQTDQILDPECELSDSELRLLKVFELHDGLATLENFEDEIPEFRDSGSTVVQTLRGKTPIAERVAPELFHFRGWPTFDYESRVSNHMEMMRHQGHPWLDRGGWSINVENPTEFSLRLPSKSLRKQYALPLKLAGLYPKLWAQSSPVIPITLVNKERGLIWPAQFLTMNEKNKRASFDGLLKPFQDLNCSPGDTVVFRIVADREYEIERLTTVQSDVLVITSNRWVEVDI